MNYSEVKELLKAGFTADEIRQMMNPQANNPQNPQDNPQEGNTNDSAGGSDNGSEKTARPDQDPAGDQKILAAAADAIPNNPNFDQLNSTMEKLIKTIQSSNLNTNSFGSLKEPDLNAEVDKIMAGIIRPERDKKEV